MTIRITKSKIFIGIILLIIPILFNHVDKLFPVVTEFTLFGHEFLIVEGLTSEDIIFTIVQKFNLIFLYLAFYILFSSPVKTKLSYFFNITIFSCVIYILYLCIALFKEFTTGLSDDMFLTTYLSLIMIGCFLFFLITSLAKFLVQKRKSEMLFLKNEINNRVENLQSTSLDIASKIKSLETLPMFIKSYDNMEDWSSHAERHAKKIYEKLDQQLKELEKTRIK